MSTARENRRAARAVAAKLAYVARSLTMQARLIPDLAPASEALTHRVSEDSASGSARRHHPAAPRRQRVRRVHPRPAATYPSVVVAVGAVNHGGWAAARCPTTQLARWWVCGVGTPTTRAIPSPHFPIANGCAQKGRKSSQGRTPVGGGGSRRAAGTGGGSILLPQPPQRQPPRLGRAQGEGTAKHRLGGGAPASCGCHHCFAR